MKRRAASLILIVLTLGQGLAWACVASVRGDEAHVMIATGGQEESAPHHSSAGHGGSAPGSAGHGNSATGSTGHGTSDPGSSRHDGSHHGSDGGSCDAMMACGVAGAAVHRTPLIQPVVSTHPVAPEPGSVVQDGPRAQDPPPPRLG